MEKTRFSTSKTARGVIYYQPDFDQTERKGEDRMPAIGFDNQKYLTTQSEQIKKRIAQFGGKLYLEFGEVLGLRLSEIIGLRWRNVDLAENTFEY